jgi:hypothetical protein
VSEGASLGRGERIGLTRASRAATKPLAAVPEAPIALIPMAAMDPSRRAWVSRGRRPAGNGQPLNGPRAIHFRRLIAGTLKSCPPRTYRKRQKRWNRTIVPPLLDLTAAMLNDTPGAAFHQCVDDGRFSSNIASPVDFGRQAIEY